MCSAIRSSRAWARRVATPNSGLPRSGLLVLHPQSRELAARRSSPRALEESSDLIAFSTPTADSEPDFDLLEPYVAEVLELLLPNEKLQLVNVNLPRQPTGLCWTRQSVRHYDGRVVPDEDPAGRQMFWISVRPIEEVEAGTDRWAFRRGLVSLTPLRLDLTDERALEMARTAHPLSP